MTVGARQRVDLTLAVGNVGETVEVKGAAKLLETTPMLVRMRELETMLVESPTNMK